MNRARGLLLWSDVISRHRHVAACLVATILGLALPSPHLAGAQGVAATERPEVRDLVIRGAERLDADEIRRSIVTEESECANFIFRFTFCPFFRSPTFYNRYYLDREEMARDVLRIRVYYWQRGFREAVVDTAVTPAGSDDVRVTFAITEGAPTIVTALRVTGTEPVLDSASLRPRLPLQIGQPLSFPALDSTIALLRAELWEEGYADALIDTAMAVDDAARLGAVRIRVDPRWVARVGDIAIEGLEELDSMTVRNSMTLQPGRIFRRSDLIESQRELYESNLFRRATIEASGDTVKSLLVSVTESDLHSLQLTAGFNTLDFVQLDGRFTDRNWLGRARRLELGGTLGNLLAPTLDDQGVFRNVTGDVTGDAGPFLRPTWVASARLTQPWVGNPRNTVATGLFAHRRSVPAVVIDRGYGADVSFTREIVSRVPVSATYRYEVTRVEAGDVYFCVNFGVCDQPTITALSEAQRLSPFALIASANRSNDPLSPTTGYVARAELEHSSAFTGSDFRHNRAFVEGAVYRPVWGRTVLAARIRAGWANALSSAAEALGQPGLLGEEILHPRKRFYAGGSRSVRGFYENQLGPRILTIAPSELVQRGCAEPFDDCAVVNASGPFVAGTDTVPGLADSDFIARPLGGSTLLEASVELRFPIWRALGGAVFLDGAALTAGGTSAFANNFGAITPGFGVRYQSPVGPIRVDLGYNPALTESLPVFTQVGVDDERRIVQVGTNVPGGDTRIYAPGVTARGFDRILNRLVLHLSIGQAF